MDSLQPSFPQQEIKKEIEEEEAESEIDIQMNVDEEFKKELQSSGDLLQTVMDVNKYWDDIAGCNFKSESDLDGRDIRDGDDEIHTNINDSARSKLNALDSAGLSHISGKIPKIILKRGDCGQWQRLECRESLNGEEKNDGKGRSSHSSALKTNVETQSVKKPFLCSTCDYRCSLSSNLKIHMRTHTGEKPFLCSRCDFRCSQSCHLKRHLNTHIGKKPFLCSRCNYRSSQNSNLRRHIKTHTGKTIPEPNM